MELVALDKRPVTMAVQELHRALKSMLELPLPALFSAVTVDKPGFDNYGQQIKLKYAVFGKLPGKLPLAWWTSAAPDRKDKCESALVEFSMKITLVCSHWPLKAWPVQLGVEDGRRRVAVGEQDAVDRLVARPVHVQHDAPHGQFQRRARLRDRIRRPERVLPQVSLPQRANWRQIRVHLLAEVASVLRTRAFILTGFSCVNTPGNDEYSVRRRFHNLAKQRTLTELTIFPFVYTDVIVMWEPMRALKSRSRSCPEFRLDFHGRAALPPRAKYETPAANMSSTLAAINGTTSSIFNLILMYSI